MGRQVGKSGRASKAARRAREAALRSGAEAPVDWSAAKSYKRAWRLGKISYKDIPAKYRDQATS